MTTTSPDLTTLSPSQVDELWAAAMEPAYRAQAALAETRRSLKRYRRHGRTPDYLVQREAEQEATLVEAIKAGEPFDAEYERRGGWTRYLLVVGSSNGHVHRVLGGSFTSSSCPSLIPGQTLVAPKFELSGSDDAGIVTQLGEKACTKCFPDAPVQDRASTDAAKGYCAGSRKLPDSPAGRRYGRCAECGKYVALSRYGMVRAHQPQARS
jgi:hypothetical protein